MTPFRGFLALQIFFLLLTTFTLPCRRPPSLWSLPAKSHVCILSAYFYLLRLVPLIGPMAVVFPLVDPLASPFSPPGMVCLRDPGLLPPGCNSGTRQGLERHSYGDIRPFCGSLPPGTTTFCFWTLWKPHGLPSTPLPNQPATPTRTMGPCPWPSPSNSCLSAACRLTVVTGIGVSLMQVSPSVSEAESLEEKRLRATSMRSLPPAPPRPSTPFCSRGS